MPRQLWIPDYLRDDGIPINVVSGWNTRGSTVFNPQAVTVHHDASSIRSGTNGALNICIHGRAGLPGPLCQVFINRIGTVFVVAAGRANHAGTGGWNGLVGNSSVFGIEAANNGVGESWHPAMIENYAKVCHSLMRGIGKDWSWTHAHKEWTTRKIDPRYGVFGTTRSINNFRQLVRNAAQTPVVEEREVPDMGELWSIDGSPHVWYVAGHTRRHVPNATVLNSLRKQVGEVVTVESAALTFFERV